jgi:hypothetical protein
MRDEAANNFPGAVEKIIRPMVPGEGEKIEISIQIGDQPNQKIRIANTLTGARGEAVALKRGAALRVIIRPKPKARV